MTKVKNTIQSTLTVVFGGGCAFLLVLMFLVALATPEKDKNGNYTQPVKYWTNDSYFCDNFAKPADSCGKK